jgi:hypothetical protein
VPHDPAADRPELAFPDARLTVSVELGPVERQSGIDVIGDAQLDDDQPLRVGDTLELIDEGRDSYIGVVESVEPRRYGYEYPLRFTARQ